MGWGAGLSGLASGLADFDAILRQRKLDELKKAESLRQEEELRLAKQRQAEEATNRQREMAMREQENQRQNQMQAKTLLEDSYSPSDALSPDAVAYAQKNMVPGYLRTEGATLPSSRWQGDPSTLRQDPGTPESTYRRPTMAERRLEDQQRQAKEIQAEALSERERQARDANLARSADVATRTQAAQDTAQERMKLDGFLRTMSNQIAQQNANTGKQVADQSALRETDKQNAVKAKVEEQRKSAVSDALEVHRLAKDLLAEPGFDSLFGLTGQINMQITPSARNAVVRLNQLTASRAIDRLIDMRRNSPTGGALGNVSDKDIQLLRDASSRLDRQQEPAAARKAAREIQQAVIKIIGYDPDDPSLSGPGLGGPPAGTPSGKVRRYNINGDPIP